MAIALVSHIAFQPGGGGGTSTSIDTTGANFLVANLVIINGGSATLTDSYGNTWTALTSYGNSTQAQLYYVASPTVGTGHTFTITGSSQFPALAVASFSGVASSSPLDVEIGNTASSATSCSTGSLTPTSNNELMITGIGTVSSHAPTVNIGTVTDSLGEAASWGVGLAYLVQTSATAENATWSQTVTQDMQVNIAFFRSSSLQVSSTYSLGSAWNSGISADYTIPTQATAPSGLSNPSFTIEFLTGIAPGHDSNVPLEWNSSRSINSILNVDCTMGVLPASCIGPVEWGLVSSRDAIAPTDWKSAGSLTIPGPIEFAGITAIIGDAPVPIEWRSTLNRDSLVPIEKRASLSADAQQMLDWTALVVGSSAINIDSVITAMNSISASADWSVGVVMDSFAPLDISGIATLSYDSTVPIEWRSSFAFDHTIVSQWTSSVHMDLLGPASWLLVVQITIVLPEDWKSARVIDQASLIDWTGGSMSQLSADSVVSIDWTLRRDHSITKGAQLTVQTVLRGI